MGGENQGGIAEEYENEVEVSLGIEDYIPRGKGNKPFWARGIDMLGYSLNSFRLSNLDFVDADSPRGSRVARLQLDSDDTQKLLDVSGHSVFALLHSSAHYCFFVMPFT
ncbi:GATA ZINC FINGER PROTEIN-RELATED [Salix purpurea]|uniref:GATA ZINC FINGER PROTEIN-RELATED n=1 Tax=Salix purpurea TaxID=77065 RepID=A0A9Q0Q1R6_SALPP|nr:GATA ZINC FINGER PROTEIN-RELATED [Salix purpurea]